MKRSTWKKIGYTLGAVVICLGALAFAYKTGENEYSKKGGLILEYHGVGYEDWDSSLVVKPEVFEKHLQYLTKEGYKIVTVEELGERLRTGKSVEKYVALSFDDGYKTNYTQAFPLMKKYNAKGTFLVINRMIGTDPMYMTETDIKEMIAGGMEIGSHTFSHNPLAEIDPKYLEWELATSQYDLEKRFPGIQVRTLAYPNGSYNADIIAKLKKYGYHQALTGHTGMITPEFYKEHPMELYRLIIDDDGRGPFAFVGMIKRGYRHQYLRTFGIDLGD